MKREKRVQLNNLKNGYCLCFVSSSIKNFLAKTDFSGLLSKLSLPVFFIVS